MKSVPALVLTALMLPAPAFAQNTEGRPAAREVTATEPVLVPNTPSGEGDPNNIVCRAPQRIAGSDQFSPQACGHNYEWQKLAANGKDLAPDGKTLIDRPTVANPKGDGDPGAVTCRTPQFVSHGPPIEVCRTNRFWADLIKSHQIVDAYGVVRPRPPIQNSGFGTEAPPPQAYQTATTTGPYVGPTVAPPYPITP